MLIIIWWRWRATIKCLSHNWDWMNFFLALHLPMPKQQLIHNTLGHDMIKLTYNMFDRVCAFHVSFRFNCISSCQLVWKTDADKCDMIRSNIYMWCNDGRLEFADCTRNRVRKIGPENIDHYRRHMNVRFRINIYFSLQPFFWFFLSFDELGTPQEEEKKNASIGAIFSYGIRDFFLPILI